MEGPNELELRLYHLCREVKGVILAGNLAERCDRVRRLEMALIEAINRLPECGLKSVPSNKDAVITAFTGQHADP